MGTCQAAGGQGPGGLVCWWLQSQTHPECYEAHPAPPGAETPPCKRRVKGSRGPTLSSVLLACGASSCRPSPQGPLLSWVPCWHPPCRHPFSSMSHTQSHSPFRFCLRTGRTGTLSSEDCCNPSRIPLSWTQAPCWLRSPPVHHTSRVSTSPPAWGQGVQFIKEDNAGSRSPGPGKH